MGFQLDTGSKSARPQGEGVDINALLHKEIHLFGKILSDKVKEHWYGELAVLLKAGVHLREALVLVAEQQKKRGVKQLLQQMTEAIVDGAALSEVMTSYKDFTVYERYSVQIGEETGTLEMVMEELGNYFERRNEQKRTIVSALTYPAIIMITAVMVVTFMLRFIVPMFEDIFKQNKVELPAITRGIIAVSNGVKDYGLVLGVSFIVLFLVVRVFLRKKTWWRKRNDQVLLHIPYIGKLMKLSYLSQAFQALGLLSVAKVPLVNSIGMIRQMIALYPMQQAFMKVEQSLLKGDTMSTGFKSAAFFDHKINVMVKVAEETNRTEYIFEKLHEQYYREVQQRSKMLSTVLEPFIIVVVGIFVGIILIAMYLPMFKLSTVLG